MAQTGKLAEKMFVPLNSTAILSSTTNPLCILLHSNKPLQRHAALPSTILAISPPQSDIAVKVADHELTLQLTPDPDICCCTDEHILAV